MVYDHPSVPTPYFPTRGWAATLNKSKFAYLSTTLKMTLLDFRVMQRHSNT
jgi:hypothetical protein